MQPISHIKYDQVKKVFDSSKIDLSKIKLKPDAELPPKSLSSILLTKYQQDETQSNIDAVSAFVDLERSFLQISESRDRPFQAYSNRDIDSLSKLFALLGVGLLVSQSDQPFETTTTSPRGGLKVQPLYLYVTDSRPLYPPTPPVPDRLWMVPGPQQVPTKPVQFVPAGVADQYINSYGSIRNEKLLMRISKFDRTVSLHIYDERFCLRKRHLTLVHSNEFMYIA